MAGVSSPTKIKQQLFIAQTAQGEEKMKKVVTICAVVTMFLAAGGAAQAAISYDQDVTPNVIFGDGNANGSFTVDQANGVELGLRAKLRHDATGQPQNTFNSNGDGTYTFNAGVAPTQSSPTAEWSFEWTINTNYDDSTTWNLGDLTYELAMTSSTASSFAAFDPINQSFADHAIGDNDTTEADNFEAADETQYTSLIAGYNVAQNSWKPHWFDGTNFDPTLTGTYTFTLKAFDSGSNLVASDAMTVNVVPEPTTMCLLGLGGLLLRKRK